MFDPTNHEFGDEGLRASILKRRILTLDKLSNGVVADAHDFAGTNGFSDDICLVGMELIRMG